MKSFILHITEEDKPYLPRVKPILVGRAQVTVTSLVPVAAMELVMESKKRGGCPVVSTSQKLLSLVLPYVTKPSIDNYAGSVVWFKDTQFLFLDPLDHLVTVSYGDYVLRRYLSKLLAPEQFLPQPEFRWELFTPARYPALLSFFTSCNLLAVDIETLRNDPDRSITCVGYTGVGFVGGHMILMTVVIPLDSEYNLAVVRTFNRLPVAKVLQNGKYDIAYFIRFGAPPTNYLLDTVNLFHCWLSELPKDLGFISGFMLREYQFHKDDGKTGNKMDYYEYNARDCYVTALTAIALLMELPDYAWTNYFQEFPIVFPAILCEHTGLKYDGADATKLKLRVEASQAETLRQLRVMVHDSNFNPGSWQQTARLFAVLGSKDVTSTGKPQQDKVANRHPLNKLLIDKIVRYREDAKENGSYFKDTIEWCGRVYYALNPHGTDTGRLASRESQFWCGLQIQNITRDDDSDPTTSVKHSFVADDNFHFGEADYSQAEARDTAYLSGDKALIEAVDDVSKDFHGVNASRFFGVPYDEIVSSRATYNDQGEILEWIHKTIAKALRDLAKRTNHGANYNMGAQVMLDTMGIQKVLTAKRLLKLPAHWSLLKVTTHLLSVYSDTYPIVKGPWYDKVVQDIKGTGLLVGPTEWTRRCFGNPDLRDGGSKRHLNSYVAHPPQSLNAMTLNKAFLRVFRHVYLPNFGNFKLHAQIHDSILFSYRIGYEHLAFEVAEQMNIPTQVTDTFGITRTLVVPVDLKGGANKWPNLKPMKRTKISAHTSPTVSAQKSITKQPQQIVSIAEKLRQLRAAR